VKIEVEVIRADQSWDFNTKKQQNYLVFEVFGIETRVPCSEEQLVQAISALSAGEEEAPPPVDEEEVRAAPSTFVSEAMPVSAPSSPLEAAPRRLAPIQRTRGDDVGIAQG
jgi:hypothetical protein